MAVAGSSAVHSAPPMSAPVILQPPAQKPPRELPNVVPMTSKAISQQVGPSDIKSYFHVSYPKKTTIDLSYGLTKMSPG